MVSMAVVTPTEGTRDPVSPFQRCRADGGVDIIGGGEKALAIRGEYRPWYAAKPRIGG